MRPGFRLSLLAGAALGVFGLALISARVRTIFTSEPRAMVSVEGVQTLEPQAPRELKNTKQLSSPIQPPVNARGKRASLPKEKDLDAREEKHEAYVAARITELRELASKTDRASLENLLSEVRNPDQEIRQAVLDIISQSGNRDAIPYLLEEAAQTEDTGMKKAIAETIDFLSLPTLTEVLRQTNPTNK